MTRTLKDEQYSGIILVFTQKNGLVYGGFPKNREIVSGKTKKEAVVKLKKIVRSMSPEVRMAYKRHGKLMRELEDL